MAPVLFLVVVAGCGSDPVEMPDVGASRLDIALSDIKRAGFEEDVEIVGGGTFGVVDESAWTVCKQEPAAGKEISAAPRLIVDRACKDEKAPEDVAEEAAEPQGTPTPQETKKAGAKPEKQAPAPVETFVMPALVGANLQDAQDRLQSLGSYVLTQTDATGMERFQVLDSGWRVCGQRPRAGATVPIDRMVDLAAVKLDERCP